MEWIAILASFLASVAGSISGIGGGVVIKPVLDATGAFSIDLVGFLSGCTVLAMTLISVSINHFDNKGEHLQTGKGILLSIGSIAGGLSGKWLFDLIYDFSENDGIVGSVQSGILIAVTIGSLLYSIFSSRIKTRNINNAFPVLIIGMFLGMISSFLGIGGGPIHLTALAFFFSMSPKKAAIHSLYIILLSQTANIIITFATARVPQADPLILTLMILCGVFGGVFGRYINRKISQQKVSRLFQTLMLVIIGLSVYNLYSFIIM
ncbi:sulfite exporter TauE/SafE family protein [Candidatus Nomurabacteria bacterium]|nr:sulfite exporter TauE/SafE family protein [Candidatus Nomurabacteria bacterium]